MSELLEIPGLTDIVGGLSTDLADWPDWRSRVLRYREKVWSACEFDRNERRKQIALCAASRDYFLAMYGFIYEPRDDPRKTVRPYIPYPRQVQLGQKIDDCMTKRGPEADILVSKSRDVGASWYLVADDLWRWRFLPSYQGRLVSRNEDLVDQIGNADSLFWKLEFLLTRLPDWMLPSGFHFKKHRLRLRLINPATGSAIIGESTNSQVGRGGRATTRKYDEAAFIRGFEDKWDSAANSTEHRIAVSTESLEEDDGFYNIEYAKNGRSEVPVFGFDWDQVPGHDQKWFELMRTRMQPERFQREVLRNAKAGLSSWVYPEAKDLTLGDFPYVAGWPLYVSIDDGYDDDTAIQWLCKDVANNRVRVVESYNNNHKVIDFYGSILRGIPEDRFMHDYDDRDFRLMEWTKTLWSEAGTPLAIFYGDHHGKQTDLSSGQNAFERLMVHYGIFVISDPLRRELKDRRNALKALLSNRMDFNNTPDVARTLEALQNFRFPRSSVSNERTTESKQGIHSWASHPVTALEYYAVNESFALERPLSARKADPFGFGFRTTLEGPRGFPNA